MMLKPKKVKKTYEDIIDQIVKTDKRTYDAKTASGSMLGTKLTQLSGLTRKPDSRSTPGPVLWAGM